jgi:thiosulfate reductase cytochrome b subunit
MVILLMSGLMIFNGWPALYWGQRTHFEDPLLAMYALRSPGGPPEGYTYVLGDTFVTTEWFGMSRGLDGQQEVRGFPAWATIPGSLSLALGRRWHFFFAWVFVINGAIYAAWTLFSGHLRRDLLPSRQQMRHIGGSIRDHILLRFPKSEHYNVLQKLSYLIAAFVMGPLMVATGLAMSPWMDAAWPWLLDIFGGRQSARTIHFITAFASLAFVLVHVLMVLLSGPVNHMRAIISGWYQIKRPKEGDD